MRQPPSKFGASGKTPRPPQTRADAPHGGATRPVLPKPQPAAGGARPASDKLHLPKRAEPPQPAGGEQRPDPRPPRGPRPPVDTTRTGLWLYGIHPVAAALANPARRARRLVVTVEAEAALAAAAPKPWPIAAETMERARLDHLLGRDVVHQGVALLADPLVSPTMAQVLERPGPVLVLDQVTDPRNVGAILRSAAAFGVAAVVLQDRHAPDETGALAKAASGALEIVPLLRAVNLVRTLVALKAAGLWIVGLDAGGTTLRGEAYAQRRIALVLGAEGEGLRRLTRETCDEIAGLAMPGLMESLNVSAAATVALYEMSRAGMPR